MMAKHIVDNQFDNNNGKFVIVMRQTFGKSELWAIEDAFRNVGIYTTTNKNQPITIITKL